ncbi:tRNA-Phe hydroxylase [Aureococcus anophagefferens]|nr:tRNA-Phe hydroxylase [Aureococcus anophagefferens]
MAAPSLPVSAAALRHADLLFAKRETSDAAREAAYALLNDNGGTLEGGALLKKCLAAVVADPYGSLGIEPGADESAIKKAYRKLALKYHPDKNDKTTALFQAIKTAYDKLLEPGGAEAAAKAWEKRKAACADARRERATARFERTRARQRASAAAASRAAAKRTSSMFDDLMAGMAAKKRHGRRAASPPIALRATDVTASTVDLAWEHAEADRSFEFQWRKRDAGVWVMASVQQALCRKKNLEPNTPAFGPSPRTATPASDWSREVVVVTTLAPATTALFSPPPRKPRAAAVHPEDDDDAFDASPSKLKRAASEFMKRMDQGARLFGSKPPSLFNSRSDKRVGVAPKRAPRKFPKPKSAPPRGWYELKDDQGAVYYWNSATDESQWEPPSSWAEEVDPASGVRYYTDGMHSTWRKPADFVDFVRHVDNRRAPGYRDWAKATTRAKRPV